ncbi:MAG: phosphoribosyltransferase family protein [Rhodothermales bacterium]
MNEAVPSGPVLLLRRLGRALLGVVYPSLCLGCDGRLPPDTAAPPLCPDCLRALPPAEPDLLRPRLADLPGGPAAFGHADALWLFDDGGTLQRIQHALKYGNRPTLGVRLGRLVGEAWRARGAPTPDLVVPVPLHRRRRLERGYNQSERLAAGISAVLGRPVRADGLTRPRPTHSQTSLSKTERWRNVEAAFAVPDAEAVAGRRVLLVDDVLTTGATAVAAARVLRSAGAEVDLAVLACTRD